MALTGKNHEPRATIRWEMLVFIQHTSSEGLASAGSPARRWAAAGTSQVCPPLMGRPSQQARQSQVGKQQTNKTITDRDKLPKRGLRESGRHPWSAPAEVWAGSPR